MLNINSILSNIDHRTWIYPSKNWLWYQEWNDAIFLHYKVDYKLLRKLVPTRLHIDTFEDNAWISIVLFKMKHIRPRNLPAIYSISFFNEVNIRTYVHVEDKPGVYFLDIIADNRISCFLAKQFSGLPYSYQKIYRDEISLFSNNITFNYKLGDSIHHKSDRDIWLTERYCLYNADSMNNLYRYDIHHLPWNIDDVEISQLSINRNYELVKKLQVPDSNHYSKGVKVVAWNKELLK